MPDITMCQGVGCEVKHQCYLHIANPTPHRQSYFVISPGKDDSCEYFSPVTENETQEFLRKTK